MEDWEQRRGKYEAAVRGLAERAAQLRAEGLDEEAVARIVVRERDDLKRAIRALDDPEDVAMMEKINLARYGDPIGPEADWSLSVMGLGRQSWRPRAGLRT